MNWDAIGATAEVVGAISVVVTLAYLAVQVRQNSKSVRASIEQSTGEFIANVTLTLSSNPDLASLTGRAFSDSSSLNEEELIRFWSWLLAALRAYEQAHHQYLEGNVSDTIWSGMDASILALFKSPIVANLWAARSLLFNSRFRAYIDSLDLSTGLSAPGEMIHQVMTRSSVE